MGRIKTEIVSVTCLALFGLSVPVVAQESSQEQKSAPATTATRATHSSWKKVADGIWKAHVSRFPDDKEGEKNPEFAVIRLSAAQYAEFQKDRKKFLNDHKIFYKDVKHQDDCPAAKPQSEKTEDAYWYLLITHWPGSTAACRAYPEWSEPTS